MGICGKAQQLEDLVVKAEEGGYGSLEMRVQYSIACVKQRHAQTKMGVAELQGCCTESALMQQARGLEPSDSLCRLQAHFWFLQLRLI